MHHSINASVNSQWHNSRFFLLFLFFNFKYSFRFYSTLQAKCTMWIFKKIFYYVFYTSSASIIDICVCHTTGLFSWEKKRPTAFEQPIHFSSWILSSYHSSTFFFYLHLNRLQKCFIFIGQFVIVLKRKWRIFVDTWQPHWIGVFVLYIGNNVKRWKKNLFSSGVLQFKVERDLFIGI